MDIAIASAVLRMSASLNFCAIQKPVAVIPGSKTAIATIANCRESDKDRQVWLSALIMMSQTMRKPVIIATKAPTGCKLTGQLEFITIARSQKEIEAFGVAHCCDNVFPADANFCLKTPIFAEFVAASDA